MADDRNVFFLHIMAAAVYASRVHILQGTDTMTEPVCKPICIKPKGQSTTYYYTGNQPRRRLSEAEYRAILAQHEAAGSPPKGKPTSNDRSILAIRMVDTDRASNPTVADAIIAWRNHSDWRDLKPATQLNYDLTFTSPYFRPLYPQRIKTITTSQIRAIAEKVIQGPDGKLMRARFNGFLGVYSALFAHAARSWPEAITNPTKPIDRKQLPSHAPWSDDDLETFITGAREPARRIILVALHTALRRSDLGDLTWGDYDGAAITTKPNKTTDAHGTGRNLRLPVPGLVEAMNAWRAEAAATLLAAGRGGDALAGQRMLLGHRGEPITARSIAELFKIERRRMGLGDHLHIHGLRATALVRMAEAGVSDRDMMAISGHASVTSLSIYLRGANQRHGAERAAAVLAGRLPGSAGGITARPAFGRGRGA